MKITRALVFLSMFSFAVSPARGDTFGSGANTFNIEFVSIGNPGNPADTEDGDDFIPGIQKFGSVAQAFRIGKFEISEEIMDKANAAGGLSITKETRGPNKPAIGVSWNEAVRFVNWLNTSSGSPPAYKLPSQTNADILLWAPGDVGYDPSNRYRNSLAKYFLPSVDEWYKAAYYDPTSGVYYDYPTGSNTAPTPVASGTAAGTAVYGQARATGPADIMLAGGLSPYGTMGQGGNVWEMEETDYDLVNNVNVPESDSRGARGSTWTRIESDYLRSTGRGYVHPSPSYDDTGFRVASISNPTFAGDFDNDGDVGGRDFLIWQRGGSTTPLSAADLADWQNTYSTGSLVAAHVAVPEPCTLLFLVPVTMGAILSRSRRRS